MNKPLVKVAIHGALADELGRSEWAFAVSSPAEALQAIEANTGKLIDALWRHWGADYFVAVNGVPVSSIEEMSVMQHADLREITFMPAFKGAGSGSGWMILAGVLLIVLVVVAPYIGIGIGLKAGAVAGTTISATGAAVGTLIVGMGLSLVLSGVASMLAPTPKYDQVERPENTPSYLFNGALNTYRQGNPVPVGFGRMIVGSQIISAGVRAVDLDVSN